MANDPRQAITSTEALWNELEGRGLATLYTKFLHQSWWPQTPLQAIQPFAEIAAQVKAQPQLIAPLIEDTNWRVNLHGVALAILAGARPLVPVLARRLGAGSWIAPQLAAGIALLGRGDDPSDSSGVAELAELTARLRAATIDSEPKIVMSIYVVMSYLDRTAAGDFASSSVFQRLWIDGSNWYDLTLRHIHFWRVLLPHFMLDPDSQATDNGT
jgi:hypothetical protein